MGFFKKWAKKIAHGVRDVGRFARKNAALIGTAVGTAVGAPTIGAQIGGVVSGIFGSSGGGAMPEVSLPAPAVEPSIAYQTGGYVGNVGVNGAIQNFSVNGQNGSTDNTKYLGNSGSNFTPILIGVVGFMLLSD